MREQHISLGYLSSIIHQVTVHQCCGSGSGRIRTFFLDPDPTIKSHMSRSKSNKLNRYFVKNLRGRVEVVGGRGGGGNQDEKEDE